MHRVARGIGRSPAKVADTVRSGDDILRRVRRALLPAKREDAATPRTELVPFYTGGGGSLSGVTICTLGG